VRACVSLCVHTLKGKWLELLTPNLVQCMHTLCGSRSACIDPKVKGQDHMVMKTLMVAWLLWLCAAAASMGLNPSK